MIDTRQGLCPASISKAQKMEIEMSTSEEVLLQKIAGTLDDILVELRRGAATRQSTNRRPTPKIWLAAAIAGDARALAFWQVNRR